MSRLPAVGLIGIGAMGMAIAKRLHEVGYPVAVRDIRPEAEEEARALGFSVCASPRELAERVELLLVVVVNAPQIDAVLFGDEGVASGLSSVRATDKTVLLCSTIGPEDTVRFGERLQAVGVGAIDAPISGGPVRAREGTMSMMLAGPRERIAACEGVLAALSSSRFHISEHLGDGARMKLVNNLIAGINLVGAAEGFALGTRLGLDPGLMYAVICASSGASWVFQDRMARVIENDFEPRAFAHILTKDMGLAAEMARKEGCVTPLGEAALARFRQTLESGWATLDDAAVIKTYQT
jgi:3-hydroxyisobutyrate dehydrogenase